MQIMLQHTMMQTKLHCPWPLKNKSNTYSAYISNVLTLIPGLNVMTSIRYESIDFKGGVRGSNDTPAYTQEPGHLSWELYMKLSKISFRYLVIIKTVLPAMDIILPIKHRI